MSHPRREALPAKVVAALRVADRRIQHHPDDRRALYQVLRRTGQTLVPLHGFYVCFYVDEWSMAFPFTWFGHEVDPGDVDTFGRDGLAYWMLQSRRTYRYTDDQGALMHRGREYGDPDARIRDCVVVPMRHPSDGRVVGLVAWQSCDRGVFPEPVVTALEWLVEAVSLAVHQADRSLRERLYAALPAVDPRRPSSPLDVAMRASDDVELVRGKLVELAQRVATLTGEDARLALERLADDCHATSSDLLEMVVDQTVTPLADDRMTPREQEIAELIGRQGLSNREIADRLKIAEKTVKTHVTAILRKQGVSTRADILLR